MKQCPFFAGLKRMEVSSPNVDSSNLAQSQDLNEPKTKKVIDPNIVTKQTESDQQKIISAAMDAFAFAVND